MSLEEEELHYGNSPVDIEDLGLKADSDLHDALSEYVRAALAILRSEYPDSAKLPRAAWRTWRPDGQLLVADPEAASDWAAAVALSRGVKQLEQRARAADVMHTSPLLVPVMGKRVSTPSGSFPVRVDEPLIDVVAASAYLVRGFIYHAAAFEQAYAALVNRLMSSVTRLRVLAPLPGVRNLRGELAIDADLVLGALTDHETELCLNMGFLRIDSPVHPVCERSQTTLRLSLEFPRQITALDARDDMSRQSQHIHAAQQKLERAMECLRLFRSGRIETPGIIGYELSYPHHKGGFASSGLGFIGGPSGFGIALEEARWLVPLWRAYWRCHIEKLISGKLALAIRRLSIAANRLRGDDRLIDALIAAEIVAEASGVRTKRGRIADTIGLLTQQDVAVAFDRAYDLRNRIVHEGLSSEDNDFELEIRQYAEWVVEVLRRAIQIEVSQLAGTYSGNPHMPVLPASD